jgi:HEPN domain-containing protein
MKRSEWANKWWQQAKHDLVAARALAANGHWDTCALMCQQAVELAVKALWIDTKQVEMPPRTHWVAQMAVDLGAPENVVESANKLVGDYISSRYPDTGLGIPGEIYTAEHAKDRLAKAEIVLGWIEQQWEQTDESSE